MPDTKVSDEAAASALAGNERLLGVQSAGNVYITPDQIAARALALYKDTDTALAANSDNLLPTQKAVKAYVDGIVAATDAMVFKGVVDCSANPNYPAADRGWTYRVSVAGKIGGGSGPNVEVNDQLLCLTDSTASGNHATVGSSWAIIQGNLDGAVIGPAGATDGHLSQFDGATGRLLKGGVALDTDTALAADSDTRVATQKAVKAYAAPAAPSITNITYAGTISVDLAGKPNGALFRCTLTGNVTVNFTGGTDGQKCVLELLQDGTGSRLVTLGAAVGFGTGITSFTATTTAAKTDVLGFIYNSAAAKYRLLAVAQGF